MNITPYEHTVQYYETDQMSVVHHSNYIRWFEEARIDAFEKIGLGYKHMEEIGIISPVVGVSAKYKTMAKFYDTVKIELRFVKYTGIRLYIEYVITGLRTQKQRRDHRRQALKVYAAVFILGKLSQ
jgi:acyl-CoA thioester hydrolase